MVCNNVEDFKNKLWNQYSDYVKGKAVLPMNIQDVCSVQAESNTLENITSYFFFKKSNREYALSNSFKTKHLRSFFTPSDTGDAVVDMVIFAYGDALNSSENWSRFSKDCILPTQTDRAGASNKEFIRNTCDNFKNDGEVSVNFVSFIMQLHILYHRHILLRKY